MFVVSPWQCLNEGRHIIFTKTKFCRRDGFKRLKSRIKCLDNQQQNSGHRQLKIKGDFLRFRAGIKLVRDVRNLQGWDVAIESTGDIIGHVSRVECRGDGILKQYQLRIECDEHILGDSKQHLIPAVPDIVTYLDANQELLLIAPPQGLLELGSIRAKVEYLRKELQPFIGYRTIGSACVPCMPLQPELEDAGRTDLLEIINQVGGTNVVGQLLGLRVAKKPNGYWDNQQTLDLEIMWFIAANWTEQQEVYSDEVYYYNQISGRITWEKPQLPQQIALDDEGSYIYLEDEGDRFMPRAKDVQAAGRKDLHNGILLNGGYQAVAKILDRKVQTPLCKLSIEATREQIQQIQLDYDLDPELIPSATKLSELGYNSVIVAVMKHGGFVQVANTLGLRHSRKARGYWDDIDVVAMEMKQFMEEMYKDNDEQHTRYLPSQKELNAAGRQDLRYGVQLFGSKQVADRMGLMMQGRRWKNSNKKNDDEKQKSQLDINQMGLVDDSCIDLSKGALI